MILMLLATVPHARIGALNKGYGGARVAQSVEWLLWAQAMIPGSPNRVLYQAPCSAGSLLLPLPLLLLLACACSLIKFNPSRARPALSLRCSLLTQVSLFFPEPSELLAQILSSPLKGGECSLWPIRPGRNRSV